MNISSLEAIALMSAVCFAYPSADSCRSAMHVYAWEILEKVASENVQEKEIRFKSGRFQHLLLKLINVLDKLKSMLDQMTVETFGLLVTVVKYFVRHCDPLLVIVSLLRASL